MPEIGEVMKKSTIDGTGTTELLLLLLVSMMLTGAPEVLTEPSPPFVTVWVQFAGRKGPSKPTSVADEVTAMAAVTEIRQRYFFMC